MIHSSKCDKVEYEIEGMFISSSVVESGEILGWHVSLFPYPLQSPWKC